MDNFLICQKKWIKDNNLKVGDTVNVTNKVDSYYMGWNDIWTTDMTCGLKTVDNLYDDKIRCDDGCYYPYFVMEIVCRDKLDKKEYIKKQNEWIKSNDIKIGDWVNVTKIAKSYENGWDNTWAPAMGHGKKQITAIHDKGIKCQNYNYPYFVMEIVKAPHDVKNDYWMVNYYDFDIDKTLSNVPDDKVAVLVEASSGIDVYIRCSFANRFNKGDAYMCGYKLLHANWGSKHDNKWRHKNLRNCIVAIKKQIRDAKASLKAQPDIKVKVI